MSRMYTVEFSDVSVTAAGTDQELFYIAPADDKPCKLVALYIGQTTEVGDAEEEQLGIKVIRGHATVGSGGSAPTPSPLNPNDPASGFTARVNDTTIASAGTPIELHADSFNVRTGYQMIWLPDARPMVTQAQTTMVVRMTSTVADTMTMSATLYVEEM